MAQGINFEVALMNSKERFAPARFDLPEATRVVKFSEIDPKTEEMRTKDFLIRVPSGYMPDLSDNFYREKEMEIKDYHAIAMGTFADYIAARLYHPCVDGSEVGGNIPEYDETNLGTRNKWIRVACKRYKMSELNKSSNGFTRLRRETQICRFHKHENIANFYETFPEYLGSEIEYIWLVSERMDHTLEKYYDHLRKKKSKIDIRHLGALLTQLLRALDYLHQRGIMHRDVTPRNIGMNQNDFQIKLLDFGLSREIDQNPDHSTPIDTPFIYQSIEVLMKAKYNSKVDIWAAALVALEMFDLKLFMPTGDEKEVEQKISERGEENVVKDRIFQVLGVPDDHYLSVFGRSVPEKPCQEELSKILKKCCEDRNLSTFKLLTEDDFRDLITLMLHPDMMKRPTADECLQHQFLRTLNTKYQQLALGNQPHINAAMKERNYQDRNDVYEELQAGYTRLSFQFEIKDKL